MAIQSKELRIGNLVLDPYGNEREVTGVHYALVYLKRDGVGDAAYPASELSPIEITVDIMGRFDRDKVFYIPMDKAEKGWFLRWFRFCFFGLRLIPDQVHFGFNVMPQSYCPLFR